MAGLIHSVRSDNLNNLVYSRGEEENKEEREQRVSVVARHSVREHTPVSTLDLSQRVMQVAQGDLPALFQSEFLRRLKPSEKEGIAQAVAQLDPLKPELIEALTALDITHPIFKNRQLSLITMQAYLEGKLTASQAGAIFLWGSCREIDPRATIHSLCDQNMEASCQLLDSHFQWVDLTTDPLFWRRFVQFLDEEGIPTTERQFFQVRTRLGSMHEMQYAPDMHMQLVTKPLRHGVYFDQSSPDPYLPISSLVVPPRLYQAMLNFTFGKQAMQMIPALGYFNKERLSNPHDRVATIPCKLVELPPVIHKDIHVLWGPGFYLHDANYHLLVESANPHRGVWIELAMHVMHRDRAQQIKWLDRDMTDYLFYPGEEKHFSNSEHFLHILTRHAFEIDPLIKQELKTYICDHAEQWKKEYELDLDENQVERALNSDLSDLLAMI